MPNGSLQATVGTECAKVWHRSCYGSWGEGTYVHTFSGTHICMHTYAFLKTQDARTHTYIQRLVAHTHTYIHY